MAPQHQETHADEASDAATAPVAVKNALLQEVHHSKFEHPELLSVFPTKTYPPIPVLPYEDRALKADPTLKNLLASATVTHLEPKIGTELSGIQLHELTNAQKDELALLVAERGVVFFRDQEITAEQQLDLGRYYGPLHVQQNLAHTEQYPEALVVENSVETSEAFLKRHAYDPANAWHTDVSYERQPPSYTIFKVLTNPQVGGDTLWASGYEAYERLTPPFKKFVEGLTAIHSGKHVADGHEFQVRFRWTKNAVAVWDNRVTAHYATFDYLPGNRHALRVTPHGEIPYFDQENP
ncbi:hypothetical protein BBJ28_00015306 [Nothophytophthora sp. Chile5]|nr:hypothetical protein BBJ28_00015306 [Nothophytophthora sp. Chile5]